MGELIVRFLIGGAAVCVFAVLGDVFKPKSFGGIFAAAPSVALASLGLAYHGHGGGYTAIEGRSMVAGALALLLYSLAVGFVMKTAKVRALPVALGALAIWLAVAFGVWALCLRSLA